MRFGARERSRHFPPRGASYGILRLKQFAYGRQSRPAPVPRQGFAGKSLQSELHIFYGIVPPIKLTRSINAHRVAGESGEARAKFVVLQRD
jgi:hypothetical protein